MNVDIYSRIERVLTDRKSNFLRLSEETGIPYTTLTGWKKADPRASALAIVADTLNLDLMWLVTGDVTSDSLAKDDYKILDMYRLLSPERKTQLEHIAKLFLCEQKGEKNFTLISDELLTSNKNDGNIILCYVFNAA